MRRFDKVDTKSWKWILIAYSIIVVLAIAGAYTGVIKIHYLFLDKVGHFFMVGSAAYLFHKVMGRKSISLTHLLGKGVRYRIPVAPILIILVFSIEELIQGFSIERSVSIYDCAANVSGVLAFMLFDSMYPKFSMRKMMFNVMVRLWLWWGIREYK